MKKKKRKEKEEDLNIVENPIFHLLVCSHKMKNLSYKEKRKKKLCASHSQYLNLTTFL